MTQRKERREERLKNIKVKKLSLHSKENHSFHIGLSALESWELLSKISKESWFLETGQKAPDCVDKTVVKILSKERECI